MEKTRSNEGTLDNVLLETDSHDQFLRMLMGSLVTTTKQSNNLPKSGLDYKYHASFAQFRKSRDSTSAKSVQMIQQLLSYCQPNDSTPKLNEEEIDPYFYSQASDVIDMLLERAERTLAQLDVEKVGQDTSLVLQQSLLYDKERIIRENIKDMQKPQEMFLSSIINRRDTLFEPNLIRKFHARVEYNPVVQYTDDDNTQGFYSHPYEFELQRIEYPSYLLKKPKNVELVIPDRLRPFDLVDNETTFHRLLEELKQCKEIAVDLEHHSFRSFQGLTCLMQISTRTKDYIIDPLALRSQMWQLGEIFANQKIVKVFHGCAQDILWLQRDFSLYVVNCFDTYVAAKLLRFPALSLAHLVRVYCGVTLDKTHQLSDWRKRPLGEDMLEYARCDTMYLLYIFDRMRRDLWNAGSASVKDAYPSQSLSISETGSIDLMEAVLAGSKRLCLNVYMKPVFDPEGFRALAALDTKLIRATNGTHMLTETQTRVLAALWDWRDYVAREEDESVGFILSNAELMRVGLLAPKTTQELRDKIASQTLSLLTPYALAHLDDIARVIAQGLSGNWTGVAGANKDVSQPEYVPVVTQSAASAVSQPKRRPSQTQPVSQASVVSFTPTVSSLPGHLSVATHSGSGGANPSSLAVAPSPIMPLDEMFRRAGWKTPQHFKHQSQAFQNEHDDMDVDDTDDTEGHSGGNARVATRTNRYGNSNKRHTASFDDTLNNDDVERLMPATHCDTATHKNKNKDNSNRLSVLSPVAFEAVKPVALKGQQPPQSVRVSKSFESLYKSLEGKIGLEVMLREIAFGVKGSDEDHPDTNETADNNNSNNNKTETAVAAKRTTVEDTLPELPRTFEEIYRKAGEVRSKKHGLQSDKTGKNKRDHDTMLVSSDLPSVDSDDEDADKDGDLHSCLVKNKMAYSNSSKKAVDNAVNNNSNNNNENKETVEQTLSMAKEIGWLPTDAAVASVRDEHFRVLNAQQSSLTSANAAASSVNDNDNSSSNNNSTALSSKNKNNINSSSSSNNNNNNNPGRRHNPPPLSTVTAAAGAIVKPFEFSSSTQAMGALPTAENTTVATLNEGTRSGPGGSGRYNNNNNNNKHKSKGGANSNNTGNSSNWRHPSKNPYFKGN